MDKRNQTIMVALAVVLVISIIGFGFAILGKLERVVQVVERAEQKVDEAIVAMAPVGVAAVEKGVDVVKSMDAEEMSEATQEGVKELGSAVKDKALKWLQ